MAATTFDRLLEQLALEHRRVCEELAAAGGRPPREAPKDAGVSFSTAVPSLRSVPENQTQGTLAEDDPQLPPAHDLAGMAAVGCGPLVPERSEPAEVHQPFSRHLSFAKSRSKSSAIGDVEVIPIPALDTLQDCGPSLSGSRPRFSFSTGPGSRSSGDLSKVRSEGLAPGSPAREPRVWSKDSMASMDELEWKAKAMDSLSDGDSIGEILDAEEVEARTSAASSLALSKGGRGNRTSFVADKRLATMRTVRWVSENAAKRISLQAFVSRAASGGDNLFVINPERSRFLQRWDIITSLALCYVAVVVPVHVAMLETRFDVYFLVSCLVDLIFWLDLFLQFFIMYPKRTNFGYALEQRQTAIITHYLKTWFFVDFISNAPVDLIGLVAESVSSERGYRAVKSLRLFRLLKLFRLARATRLMQRFEARASIAYGKLALLKFFLILFIITHWLSNMWALTLRLVEEGDGMPRWIDGFTVRETEANIVEKTKDTPWKLYITCLYFTSYTITSVGYGDIGPVNIVETVVSTIMIVIAGISWAVVLGQVCGIVSNMDTDEQLFRSRMDELNKMMDDRLIATSMRRRLRSFFLSNKTAARRARHRHILLAMSPGLRGEVALEINRPWISKVPLLNQFVNEANTRGKYSVPFAAFLVEVSLRLNTSIHAQSETFGVPHELYILLRGLVGHNNKIRQSGSVWGLDFVISDHRLQDSVDAFALTYVELMTLRRNAFMEVVEKHCRSCPELRRRVRHAVCWMAVQRAVMREAARRQHSQLLALQAERRCPPAQPSGPAEPSDASAEFFKI